MHSERKEQTTVLGVMKTDIQGHQRMRSALETIKPDILVGESSQLLAAKASTREMIWSVLFDEMDVPPVIQEKWKALQTHKEHYTAQQYSSSLRIPYFMVNHEEDDAHYPHAASLYAQQELVEELRNHHNPEHVRSYIADMVNRKFDKLYEDQIERENIHHYYSAHYLCKQHFIRYAEEHAFHFLHELNTVRHMYSGAKICMFIDGLQIVNPHHSVVMRQLNRPFYNLRHYLGEDDATYHQLVEFSSRDR